MLLALVVVGLGIAIGLLAVSALVPVGERPAKQALRQIEQYGAQMAVIGIEYGREIEVRPQDLIESAHRCFESG